MLISLTIIIAQHIYCIPHYHLPMTIQYPYEKLITLKAHFHYQIYFEFDKCITCDVF